ncbi:helix-turn-helix domain-containing protein [Terasakiella sp.]|uniref:helix-turn-helix domain-containing protein n=1 Tax=Terasakiella sp. TaxID=2034861 RepID=UPI003AA9484D
MLTSEQIKGARGLLNWSARELAEKCSLGLATIQRMENRGTAKSTVENLIAVKTALENAGIIFIEEGAQSLNGGAGVRLKG